MRYFSSSPRAPQFLKFVAAAFLALAFANEAGAQIVINEIHFDPDDNTKLIEFIELHNPTATPVSVAGWHLEDAVDYIIPADTTIAANGYLVVAQNVAAFQARFGFTPLGPWVGALSADGERIQLRNTTAALVDEVSYGAGFPWPTGSRGGGKSMELINPSLDNDLAGSWRASGVGFVGSTLIPVGSSGWHWRAGSTEASTPISDWRKFTFVEDGTWSGDVTLPLGYGDIDNNTANVDVATTITGMQNGYRSVFLRKTFTINPGQVPPSLKLRLRCDDGCIVWLNGVEIAPRVRVDAATPTFNTTGMTITNAVEPPLAWEPDISILNANSILQVGTNVMAIQVFNSSLASSDLYIDTELLSAAPDDGTPGGANSTFVANAPPAIRQVENLPVQPTAGVPVTVTAKVTDPNGVASVQLQYQTVDPGAYIRKIDAAYTTAWTNIAMVDNGTAGDLLAADGIYTAVVPGTVQTHRRLIRYRIVATDSLSATIRVPYEDDEQPNFAYFCYNGIPAWTGRNQPPSGTTTTFPTSLMTTLPAYFLIANETDVINSQYNSAFDTLRMWGTMIYEGQVYDHILFHNKGSASTYQSGKNKWRFHLNRARDFTARDSWGKTYASPWDTFTMHACASPWNPVFRGWAGLDEVVSARVYQLAGVPASNMHHLQFRVIRRANESAAAGTTVTDPMGTSGSLDGQYSGDLWGLYMAIEDPDGSFLDDHGFPDGNVYHIASNAGDKTHQGLNQPTTTADWDTFRNASQANTVDNPTNEAWWRANLDINVYASFHGGNRITGNVDLREGWNHYFYHRSSDNRFLPVPWDLDMMYFPETHWSGTIDQKNCLLMANISRDAKNRMREMLDLLCEDASATGGQFAQIVREYKSIIRPAGHAAGWDLMDQYLWNYHPRTTGGHLGRFYGPNPTTDGRIGGTWTRTYTTADFSGICDYMVAYATDTDPDAFAIGDGDQRGYAYNYLELEAADAAIPNRPSLASIGSVNYPANDLRFRASAFTDPQGNGTFASMEWRLGEIAAPGVTGYVAGDPYTYEMTTVWTSGELPIYASDIRVPGSIARPGHTYRARVRLKDNTGRWSRWSPAVQFVASVPNVDTYVSSLVITEFLYAPTPVTPAEFAAGYVDSDFEYIELRNVSTTPLDLTDVRFTKGIDFDFPVGYTLAPGAAALVVKNLAAFNSRYGSGKPIAGVFLSGSLNNGGEEIKLSYGAGTTIRTFTYTSLAPWPAIGTTGASLVLRNPYALPDHALPENWRASLATGGDPGGVDSLGFAQWASPYGVTAAGSDEDHDGLTNLMEYAFGGNPGQPNTGRLPVGSFQSFVVQGSPSTCLTVSFRRVLMADDIIYHPMFSTDLNDWAEDGVLVSSTPNGDGTVTDLYRSREPANQRGYVKVGVELR